MTKQREPRTLQEGESRGWLASILIHMLLLFAIAALTMPQVRRVATMTLASVPNDDVVLEEVTPEPLDVSELEVDDIGEAGEIGLEIAVSTAPTVEEWTDTAATEMPPLEAGRIRFQETLSVATGSDFNRNFQVRGLAGVGTTGASGAIDRLTHEILMSLEERPTLVVWLLDQSASVTLQRKEIHDRLDRIYRELGAVQASGAFADFEETPLLSSVIAFGQSVTLLTERPTDDVDELKEAVASIERDDSGIENVFGAVMLATEKYRKYRRIRSGASSPARNVILIVFTDEAGDDQALTEQAVDACVTHEIPVYVVGVPAPFGEVETLVKWVDPDPRFDQTPQWGRVNQGPESFYPERIRLRFAGASEYDPPMDSGFGPYALTRLCYETGGIYFTVHPNRDSKGRVRRHQVGPFAAHLQRFFDEKVMRRYRPDYVDAAEQMRRINGSPMRKALTTAARQSWIKPMESPRLRFPAPTEAALAQALTEAQKNAARLEPLLLNLFSILQTGESEREQEESIRWQAGYDLAMGRTMAALVRTQSYNAMLAQAKRGMAPKDPKNNTWVLRPSSELEVSSQLKKLGDKADTYLQRVIEEHPDTPWAAVAQRERSIPLGWSWSEDYTPTPEERRMANNNRRNRLPRDDRARMLDRKPTRKVPRL